MFLDNFENFKKLQFYCFLGKTLAIKKAKKLCGDNQKWVKKIEIFRKV